MIDRRLIKPLLVLMVVISAQLVSATQQDDARYAGSAVCATCHQSQYQLWQGSHHERAMMAATNATVSADFNHSQFSYNGVTSTFFKKNGEFWVNTDGADGQLKDFRIDYTFGTDPIQQYLIGFDDGRYQALTIAWDTRPKAEGGQRWFHLYPDQKVDFQDVLHWTRQANNWNSRCAECHSTQLQKNYQQHSNRYDSHWFEINVACESCHGPGARHVAWAKQPDPDIATKGLLRSLQATAEWYRPAVAATATTGTAVAGGGPHSQLQACAGCHSHRQTLFSPAHRESSGQALLDSYQISLIESPLYQHDGQIQEEVYVYGSFLQSKMHQRGVVCSNCHNPHSLKLKANGNQLCAQCHDPRQFDRPQHHHHGAGSAGAQCVNCHMPETTYMVIDPRRDHSLRIPRPDLSQTLGVGNACNQCHQQRSVDWAADVFQQWYPKAHHRRHFGEVFFRAGQGVAQALPQLVALIENDSLPALVRASALLKLRYYPGRYAINVALTRLDDSEAMLRLAAIQVLQGLSGEERQRYLLPLLNDPVRAVRLQATRLLAGVTLAAGDSIKLAPEQQAQRDIAVAEYLQSIQYNADMPAGQMQLGVLYQALEQWDKARQAYRQALLLEPSFIPARVNLADMYRQQGRDHQALPLLQQALQIDENNGEVNFAMGLLQVRLQQLDKALPYLQRAASQTITNSHYAYVYAVALFEAGHGDGAVLQLKQALEQHPTDQQLLAALIDYLRALGRHREARQYAGQGAGRP